MGRPKTPRTNLNVQKMKKKISIKKPDGRVAEKTIVYRRRRLRQPVYIRNGD